MGDHIIGIKKLNEISGTVKGANEHCTKLFSKSFGNPTAQKPEQDPPAPNGDPEMDKVLMKALLSLDDTGRAYAAGLEDDACEAFLRKSAEDRAAEVKADTEAKEAAAAAAEAEKEKTAGGDPEVVELRKKLATMEDERKVEKAEAKDRELREVAKTKYAQVPDAYDQLKAAEDLPEAGKNAIMKGLDRQQDMAKNFGKTLGADTDQGGEGSAKVKYDARVGEIVKEKSISKAEAAVVLNDSAETADRQLVRDYRDELRAQAA